MDFKVFPWHCKKSLADTFTPDSVVAAFKKLYGQRGELKHESSDISELEHVEEYANELSPDHVIIEVTGRHHGMGNLNPLGFVKFYSKHNPNSEGIHLIFQIVANGDALQRVWRRTPTTCQ